MSSSLMAEMQGIDEETYAQSGTGIRLADYIPRCSHCNAWLLSGMRAACADCRAVVCRRSRECRHAHAAVHVQKDADKLAVSMAIKNLPAKQRQQVWDWLKGKRKMPPPVFGLDQPGVQQYVETGEGSPVAFQDAQGNPVPAMMTRIPERAGPAVEATQFPEMKQ